MRQMLAEARSIVDISVEELLNESKDWERKVF
jgi:hypothetical protein